MTIQDKLINHLNKFELVTKDDKITGIKATDKKADLAIFTDELNEYERTTPLNVIKGFLEKVGFYYKFVDEDFISLIKLNGVYDAISFGNVQVIKNAAYYDEAGGLLGMFELATGWEIPDSAKYEHFKFTG